MTRSCQLLHLYSCSRYPLFRCSGWKPYFLATAWGESSYDLIHGVLSKFFIALRHTISLNSFTPLHCSIWLILNQSGITSMAVLTGFVDKRKNSTHSFVQSWRFLSPLFISDHLSKTKAWWLELSRVRGLGNSSWTTCCTKCLPLERISCYKLKQDLLR